MIDFNDAGFLRGDRIPAYDRLRAEQPVWHMPSDGHPSSPDTWVVSRHADVEALLRLQGTRVQPLGMDAPPWMAPGPALNRLRANLSQTDAPVHTRMRGVLGPLFIPRRIEALRGVSADSVARALRAVADREGPFDIVQEIAQQVPKGVICHMLGIPESDWPRLIARQHDHLLIFSFAPLTPDETARLNDVVTFYHDYFAAVLDDPAIDTPLLTALRQAQGRGELSRGEVISVMETVLDAGFETTRTSISNAVELLACEPGLFAQLRRDPALIQNAVEELLRVRTPIHVRHRFLTQPFTASDHTVIPAGAMVLLVLAGANRDPAVFSDPHRIDFGRANASRHQAFGGGMHHCLGAPLARIQLQETLRGLAGCYASLSLPDGPGPRHASLKFPALTSLRVSATRSQAELAASVA
jgi:cytochrome P450